MADNLNHAIKDVRFEQINVSLHPEGENNTSYHTINKFMNNYTPIFKEHGWSDKEIQE